METTDVAGGHRNIFDQLNRLKKFGYAPELWALSDETSWFRLEVPVRVFESFPRLAEALAQEEAIKVATWWKTGSWVWLASVEKGIPAWLVQDIESSYYAGDPLREAQVFSGYRREFRYFTICQWNVEQLEALGVKAALQPCGIDLSIYKVLPGVKREANALMTSGRANPLKNLPLTLEAWGRAKPQPELWMYGTEPELARGLTNARYFERPSDAGICEMLNRATAFILTSRHEGFALTILEAMAAGCPVICTDADGNRDFCVDGENCLMLGKDDAAGLTRAIERLFGDPGLQRKLRENGFKTAQSYDWDRQVRSLMDFFGSVAG
jgi:glycosyltransferase involved in cell wall biosynthesis